MNKVFLSHHYVPDYGRANRIRALPGIFANQPAMEGDWNLIVRKGDDAIRKWIDRSMEGRPCTILLIGRFTRGRKWVEYEIRKTWREERALLAINIHHLADQEYCQTSKGGNPLDDLVLSSGMRLSQVVKTYDPPYTHPEKALAYIRHNINKWIDTAFEIRRTREMV